MRLSPDTRASLLLYGSFTVAILLAIMPLPSWAEDFRPDWVGLVLVYWCIATPQRVGVGTGWGLGLILDVLYGHALLGLHALTKATMAYIAMRLHLQLRMFPRWQQALAIGVLLFVSQLIVLWVRGAVGQAPKTFSYWTPAIVGLLMWPLVFNALRRLRRHGDIR
jgi:rod shape-determining protein MreD